MLNTVFTEQKAILIPWDNRTFLAKVEILDTYFPKYRHGSPFDTEQKFVDTFERDGAPKKGILTIHEATKVDKKCDTIIDLANE